jgi:hypothetical protein
MKWEDLRKEGFSDMKYIKSEKYNTKTINDLFMGPNPIKLTEELLLNHQIPNNATVMDLGCGRGITSVFLAKEYGFLRPRYENVKKFTQKGGAALRIYNIGMNKIYAKEEKK